MRSDVHCQPPLLPGELRWSAAFDRKRDAGDQRHRAAASVTVGVIATLNPSDNPRRCVYVCLLMCRGHWRLRGRYVTGRENARHQRWHPARWRSFTYSGERYGQRPAKVAWPGPDVRKLSMPTRASAVSNRPTAASVSRESAPITPAVVYARTRSLTTEKARVGPAASRCANSVAA